MLHQQDGVRPLGTSDVTMERCSRRQRYCLCVAISGFIILIAALSVALIVTRNGSQQTGGGDNLEYVRLPGDVAPINYDLEIETNMTTFLYKGTVTIRVKVSA